MRLDVAGEEADALVGVEIDHLDPVLPQPVETTGEVDRFAHHHGADIELAHQAAAVPAGRERGDHDLVAVGALAAGLAEGVGLAVHRGIALLHPAVVAAAEEPALAVEEGRADGDATLGQALPGFLEGDLQHRAVVGRPVHWPAFSMDSPTCSTGIGTSAPAVPGSRTSVTETLSPNSRRSPFLSRLKARPASSRKSSPGESAAGSSKEVMLPT